MSAVKIYRVREGVEWVNGARVPADRKVKLTDAEARFDLEQGRIAPARTENPSTEIAEEAAEIDQQVATVEQSIEKGARHSKKRFKLSGDADGRD